MRRASAASRIALAFLLLAPLCRAQPTLTLRITGVDISRFPTVSLKIEIRRDGAIFSRLKASDFTVAENGALQPILDLSCPGDTTTRLSVAILLDRSNSMGQDNSRPPRPDTSKIFAAKQAIRTFVNFMDVRDEAGIFSFSSNVPPAVFFQMNQQFTNDKLLLRGSLDPIKPGGGTQLWQAIVRTLDSLNSRQGKRVLIVLTDGRNSSGFGYTVQSAITRATSYKIPVYTIGLGNDLDESDLQYLANATAGQFFRSPDETQLNQVFTELAAEILTDACELIYLSRDACLDGTLRRVELTLTGGGFSAEDTTSLTVPNQLSPVTLVAGNLADVPSRSFVRVPVYLLETLSPSDTLSYAFTALFNTNYLRFSRVETAGTISAGGAVSAVEIAPGSVRCALSGHIPAMQSGTLVELEFYAQPLRQEDSTRITLADAVLEQTCPVNITVVPGLLTELPCDETYRIGIDTLLIASPGDDFQVPLLVTPRIDPGRVVSGTLEIGYDRHLLRFLHIDAEGTLAAQIGMSVNDDLGTGTLTLQFKGTLRDTTFLLGYARFEAIASVTASSTLLNLRDQKIQTDCRSTASAVPTRVLIDGICERIVAPAASKAAVRNHPNPFNPETSVRITVPADGPARVIVQDALGREVARLVDGWMSAGQYRLTFDGTALPAGVYHAVLQTGRSTAVHPMLLVK